MEVSQSETRLTEFFSSFFSSQQSTDQPTHPTRPMNKTGSDSQLLVNHNTGSHVGGPRDHTRGASVNGLDPAILGVNGVNGGQLSNTSSNNNKLGEKRSGGEKKKKGYWYNVSILCCMFWIWLYLNSSYLNWILYPSKLSWVQLRFILTQRTLSNT